MEYLVTISQTITVEADNEDDAMIAAAEMFDFGSADFDLVNANNLERGGNNESYIKAI